MKLQVLEKLKPIWEINRRFKVIIGGRGSGKSQGVGDRLLACAANGEKVGCFREFQNSLQDSVHSLLCEEIKRVGFSGFIPTIKDIWHESGGLFTFKGLSKSPEATKSMHGFKKFWCEEAQTLSEDSIRILGPTLRADDSELYFTANPQSSADPFSQRFIEPFKNKMKNGIYIDDLHLIIECNYVDNCFFPDVLEQERKFDYENLPRALYDHIWLGQYNDFVENSIILAEWFDACVDAHEVLGFKPRGRIVSAFDPSDSGDARGYACRHGSLILECIDTEEYDVNESCDWALGMAIDSKADLFVWDADGLGISLQRQINQALEGKRIEIYPFRGNGEVEDSMMPYDNIFNSTKELNNEDAFKNLRAQNYIRLRDRVYSTYLAVTKKEYIDPEKMISFSSKISCLSRLKSELCRIPTYPNPNGMIQIMSKTQMKKNKIKSPNLADAVMMTMVGKGIKSNRAQAIPKSCIV